jgi:hypothetical protein
MVPIIISSMATLVTGLLLGGCSGESNELSKSLFARNAQLETQINNDQNIVTSLAITAVVLACGLGASIYKSKKGKKSDKSNKNHKR